MGIRHTSAARTVRGVKPVPNANAGRVEWALLTAVTVVALIAVLGTAGAKTLARLLGAE